MVGGRNGCRRISDGACICRKRDSGLIRATRAIWPLFLMRTATIPDFTSAFFARPPLRALCKCDSDSDARAFETLAFGEIRAFDGWSVKLLPAGHVLGSAQLFYESDRGTLLYTGDFKLRKGLSSEGAVTTHAETLVMETTYGLPRYQFPPVSQTLEAVVKFCMEALEDGRNARAPRLCARQGAGDSRGSSRREASCHGARARLPGWRRSTRNLALPFRLTQNSNPRQPPDTF